MILLVAYFLGHPVLLLLFIIIIIIIITVYLVWCLCIVWGRVKSKLAWGCNPQMAYFFPALVNAFDTRCKCAE